MTTPRPFALVTLTSGHRVRFIQLLPDHRMRVESLKLKIQYETSSARLPYLPS